MTEFIKSNLCLGRPMTAIIHGSLKRVKQFVFANWQNPIRKIAGQIEISIDPCQVILTERLNVRMLMAKFVPKQLNVRQMKARKENLLTQLEKPNLLEHVIRENRDEYSENKPQREKIARSRAKTKMLLTVCFHLRETVPHEFQPSGYTVLKTVLSRNFKLGNCASFYDVGGHHCGTTGPTSFITTMHRSTLYYLHSSFCKKNSVCAFPQPSYLPDLASCHFFLFPYLKKKKFVPEAFRHNKRVWSYPDDCIRIVSRRLKKWPRKCGAFGEDYFEIED